MQPEDVCKLEPCCLDPLLVRAHHKLFITLFIMYCHPRSALLPAALCDCVPAASSCLFCTALVFALCHHEHPGYTRSAATDLLSGVAELKQKMLHYAKFTLHQTYTLFVNLHVSLYLSLHLILTSYTILFTSVQGL